MRKIILVLAIILISQNAFSEGPPEFINPEYRGLPLDWCLKGSRCGQAAADEWCRKVKHYNAGAASFKRAPSGSKYPTRLIGTDEVCDQETCASFSKIVCEGTPSEKE